MRCIAAAIESAEETPLDRTTMARSLKRAAEQGTLTRSGAGTRGDPHVYWLPEREPFLFPGYDAGEEVIRAWKERCAADMTRRFRELEPARKPV